MKILLLSYYFPPVNSIGSLRTGKTAKYLTRMGHEVKIVAAHDYNWLLDLPIENPVEDIHSFEVPKNKDCNIISSLLSRISRTPYLIKNMYQLGKTVLEEWDADVILASSPPPHSLIAAMLLSKKFRIPWIADIRDLWADHYVRQKGFFRRSIDIAIEKKVLSSCAGIVTISNPLRDRLSERYHLPIEVIFNGYDNEDYDFAVGTDSNDKVTLSYTGTIYPRNQKLEPLFDALEMLGQNKNNFQVDIYTRNHYPVVDLLKDHSLSSTVFLRDVIPYKDIVSVQTKSDILLLLLWQQNKEMGVFPGKFFEYLGARRPILGIGDPDCELGRLILDRGAGFVSDDPSVISQKLLEWQNVKHNYAHIPFLDPDVARGFTREEEAMQLALFLEKVVVKRHATI